MNQSFSIFNYAWMLLVLLTLTLTFSSQAQTVSDKKVLMVLSSHGVNQGEERPGYEFDEFSKAYLVFKQNGLEVDIASPRGGAVEADKYNPNESYNKEVLEDQVAMTKLADTLALEIVEPNNYAGIFVVGGKGAMFDLPKDKNLQTLIREVYQAKGSVAAVCHGPAALVDVKLSDGSYLVANKAINSFTNEEEKLFGKKWLKEFDFMLEDKLVERGAKFQSSNIMLSHVAVDGRLITGQNPSSTVAVATELVRTMGLEPVKIKPYLDDKTLAVVADFFSGDNKAVAAFQQNPTDYNMPLVGMYGFYFLKVAESDVELNQALALMLTGQKAINHPKLDMQIAETQLKLGKKQDAKATLNAVLKTKPDFQPALDMLKNITL